MEKGAFTFTYKEFEAPDGSPGRTISFDRFSVEPCGFTELKNAKSGDFLKLPLVFENAHIIASDAADVEVGSQGRIASKLESLFTSNSIGLVAGGWLPSSLAAYRTDATIFPDRNVITEFVSRFANGGIQKTAPDFLDLFKDAPIRINPLFYVLEGNRREAPDTKLIGEQLIEALQHLKRSLPNAVILIGTHSFDQICELMKELRIETQRKQDFLLALAPLLTAPVARTNIDAVWSKVIELTNSFQIPSRSLLLLAILSSISIENGSSPAKRIFKFNQNYTKNDAYNAAFDFQSLDLLTEALASSPNEFPVMITKDINLGLFWAGIKPSNFVRINDEISFDLSPHPEVIPDFALSNWLLA